MFKKIALCTAAAAMVASTSFAAPSCFEHHDDQIGLKLCMEDTEEITRAGQDFAVIEGTLSNIGAVSLCNITFDIMDLDMSDEYSPATLPRVPDSFDPSEEYAFRAVVPVDQESHVLPYADVWSTFYACSPMTGEDPEVADEAPKNKKPELDAQLPVNEKDFSELITPETVCFMGCYNDVVANNGGDAENIAACPAMNYIFTHNCHTCDPFVLAASKDKCLEFGCSADDCTTAGFKTSAAMSSRMSAALFAFILGVAAYLF